MAAGKKKDRQIMTGKMTSVEAVQAMTAPVDGLLDEVCEEEGAIALQRYLGRLGAADKDKLDLCLDHMVGVEYDATEGAGAIKLVCQQIYGYVNEMQANGHDPGWIMDQVAESCRRIAGDA